jgi:DNA-binding PadR family transcriptional regulator
MAPLATSPKTGRAMTSTVNWTLLGLVIERPSYGLELFNRYQRLYLDVLPVSGESHVYSALDVLEKRGLVEQVPGVRGIGRQPKPHYKATMQGFRSYEDWLVEQVSAQLRQQQLWVRQLAIFADDSPAALRILGRFREEYLKEAGETGRPADGSPSSSRELIDGLVVEQQRISIGGMLTWLGTALARFEHVAGGPGGDDPPRA